MVDLLDGGGQREQDTPRIISTTIPGTVLSPVQARLSAVVVISLATAGCGQFLEPAPLEWLDQLSGTSATFRGASAASDLVAWAVGARGRIMRISGF